MTTKSDTPETDAQTWTGHCGDGDWGKVVYAHFAGKLERERDQYAAMLSEAMPFVYASFIANDKRESLIARFESLELTPSAQP